MDLNEENLLNLIRTLYPELNKSKLRLVRFSPGWELYVD